MNIFKHIVITSIALLGLSSCIKDQDPIANFTYDLKENYSYVTNLETNESVLLPGANYNWAYTVSTSISSPGENKVTIKVSELQVTAGGSRISFEIPDVKYSIVPNTYISATVDEVEANGHTITDFTYRQYSNIVGHKANSPRTCTYFQINFTVDNLYKVTSLMSVNVLAGRMTYTNDKGESTASDAPFYAYTLNLDKRTANFIIFRSTINSVQFSEINYKDVPFTIGSDEFIIETDKAITPKGVDDRELTGLKTNNLRIRCTFRPDLYAKIELADGNTISIDASITPLDNEK